MPGNFSEKSVIETMRLDYPTPAPDRPVDEFMVGDVSQRADAVRWATSITADVAHHDDDTLLRAAKTLKANCPLQMKLAGWLIQIIEGKPNANRA